MTAIEKTEQLERKFIDINLLDPNPENPNEMSDAEFNPVDNKME